MDTTSVKTPDHPIESDTEQLDSLTELSYCLSVFNCCLAEDKPGAII